MELLLVHNSVSQPLFSTLFLLAINSPRLLNITFPKLRGAGRRKRHFGHGILSTGRLVNEDLLGILMQLLRYDW